MRMSRINLVPKKNTRGGLFLILLVLLAFLAEVGHAFLSPKPTISSSSSTSLHVKKNTARMVLWPAIQKLSLTPDKIKLIAKNVAGVTHHWQDLVLAAVLAFGLTPAAKFAREKMGMFQPENDEEPIEQQQVNSSKSTQKAKKIVERELYRMKRFGVISFITQLSKISLSVYVVDVLMVVLTTLGFKFPEQWRIAEGYSRFVYVGWAVNRLLLYKKTALCRFFRVDADDMGRVEILNRGINVLAISLVSLLCLDWMSVQMNMALSGLFAFGSAGTIAFTLASQGLFKQLINGLLLTFSNKMYVGDIVTFGDGTSGKVIKLGFFDTVLRRGDNTMIRVPNDHLGSQTVSNVSRVRQSQVKQTLRFHFDDADKIPDLLNTIKSEIQKACPRLIIDGTRPFRVFWTNINDDHLEVMVDTHHNIAPLGDAYWINRQNLLKAIQKALKMHDIDIAQLYTFATSSGETEMRVFPKNSVIGVTVPNGEQS